jgi:predicted Zn-dependent protease
MGQLRGMGAVPRAKAALARGEPTEARIILQAARQTYPDSDEVAFLLAQAFRREGDLNNARRMLEEAEKLGWVKEAIHLEQGLMLAGQGNVAAEAVLEDALDKGGEGAPVGLICEVLVPNAVVRYELGRAEKLLKMWTEAEPEDGSAWLWKGRLLEVFRDRKGASEAYKKAVELRPKLDGARRRLVRLLLELNEPAEAAGHLEALAGGRVDADYLRLKAEYLILKGDPDGARRILDGLLEDKQRAGAAVELLHLRGKLELEAKNPKKAAEYLQKAMDLDGYEPKLLHTWSQCMEKNGETGKAKEMEDRRKAVLADLDEVSKLTREVARSPKDPAPRRRIGELFVKNKQLQEGGRWLESARLLGPDDPATHKALAAYWDARAAALPAGDKQRQAEYRKMADHHRSAAAKPPPPKKTGG